MPRALRLCAWRIPRHSRLAAWDLAACGETQIPNKIDRLAFTANDLSPRWAPRSHSAPGMRTTL